MRRASNSKDVKISNRLLVRDTIRRKGLIARSELAKETGLTPPTVTVIVNELIKDGVVREVGRGESSGGRRPVMLELNPKAVLIFAIRIQRGEVVAAIFDLIGNILNQHSQTLDTASPEKVVEAIGQSYDWLVHDTSINKKLILWCGIATPGLVDTNRGVVERSSNLGWEKVPLGKMLSERLGGLPVHVENISNSAALAETEYGGGQGSTNLIYLNLSVGIGAGIIFNKEIYRGFHGYAGEIGHMTLIPENGPPCTCGSNGCFESVCGINAILERAKAVLDDDLLEPLGIAKAELTFQKLLSPPLRESPAVKEVLAQSGYYIGIAVGNLLNLFNLDTVVLGGELAQTGEAFLNEIKTVVRERVFSEICEGVRIICSNLKEDPPLKGIYALVVKKIFATPEWFGSDSSI